MLSNLFSYIVDNADVIMISAAGSFLAALLFWAIFHWQFVITFLGICAVVFVIMWVRSRI